MNKRRSVADCGGVEQLPGVNLNLIRAVTGGQHGAVNFHHLIRYLKKSLHEKYVVLYISYD